jgi:hypothetical protein
MSFAIRHRVELESSTDAVLAALTTEEGLAAWWTPMVKTTPEVGTIAEFRFGDGAHGPDMRITKFSEECVAWRCVEGPWKGMDFTFTIDSHNRGSVLVLEHAGWTDQGDFYMHCNTKWGYFLAVSLKQYLETGTGHPHPEDPSI